ncbi:MAG: cytochrome c oxidase assembly protein, partial [Tistlia sp.]
DDRSVKIRLELTEQKLEPGESVDMGVSFFVDPAIVEDANAAEVGTITLSYTFFADAEAEAEVDRDGEATTSALPPREAAARQSAALPQ